jgi:translocator protein
MNQIASAAQLRMSFLRWALFIVPLIMLLGYVSAMISGPIDENRWYGELIKPAIQPPGWVFAVVWPILYFMMGCAFAMVLHARGATSRGLAIGLFVAQLVANLAWSPLFFGRHEVTNAFYLLLVIFALAFATTMVFGRIRKAAAWLMVPYLAWLSFAAILAFQIDQLNPDAEALYVPASSTQIGGSN